MSSSRFVSVVCLLVVCLPAFHAEALKFVSPSDPAIDYIGRYFDGHPDSRTLGWSGAQVKTVITATTTVVLDFSDWDGNTYLDVLFDEAVVSTIRLTKDRSNITISATIPKTAFTLTLVKRTETFTGMYTFYGMYLSEGATVKGPQRLPRRIEFVGDSITCGYGNLGTPPCGFTPITENARVSHGAVAAELLSAEYFITAWSGIGVVRNNGEPTPVSALPLPAFYNNTVGQFASQYGYWDFAKWVPQALVINLGTNDFGGRSTTDELYTNAYVDFIAQIRRYYKAAPPVIFLGCGPMSSRYCTDIKVIANSTGVHLIPEIPPLTTSEIGCDGHPNYLGDASMGKIEAAYIKTVMKW